MTAHESSGRTALSIVSAIAGATALVFGFFVEAKIQDLETGTKIGCGAAFRPNGSLSPYGESLCASSGGNTLKIVAYLAVAVAIGTSVAAFTVRRGSTADARRPLPDAASPPTMVRQPISRVNENTLAEIEPLIERSRHRISFENALGIIRHGGVIPDGRPIQWFLTETPVAAIFVRVGQTTYVVTSKSIRPAVGGRVTRNDDGTIATVEFENATAQDPWPRDRVERFFGSPPPGSSASAADNPNPGASTGNSVAARLRELDQLKASGLITEAEYSEKRSSILGDL